VTTYPDAVALTLAHLAPLLAPVPVRSRVPDPRPVALLQVRRVGGGDGLVRDFPLLELTAWDADEDDAHNLLMSARSHVHAMQGQVIDGVQCYTVAEFSGPRQSDDPRTGTPRYVMTVELSLRAE
jgi:hypothetical protein